VAYVRPVAFYLMEFTGELAGLNIRVRGLDANGRVELAKLEVTADNPLPAVDLFIRQVDRWDLEYADGRTVPVSLSAFLEFDMSFIQRVTATWVRDVVTAPFPAQPALFPAASPEEDGGGGGFVEDVGPDLAEYAAFLHDPTPAAAGPGPVPELVDA
jgi:hypothetical protein